MSATPPITLSFRAHDADSLAGRGNVIPLVRELPGDLLTPVGAFLRLAPGRSRAFLLESVEGGERIGRYSFLGFDPWVTIRRERLVAARGTKGADDAPNPLGELRSAVGAFRPVPMPDLPPFTGGAVGLLAYDAVRAIERLPGAARDDLGAPDLDVGLYDTVVAFDRVRQRIQIVANILPGRDGRSPREEYARAEETIGKIASRLEGPLPKASGSQPPGGDVRKAPAAPVANLDQAAFEARVLEAKREISRGEIFQVVLSRRLEQPFAGDPFSVYRALRAINPSPYNFFLKNGETSLAGASPEMLVRVQRGVIETRPIAGTRRRGANEEEDARLEADLLADPKERAEHLMLVDLGRNDVGKVSDPGTVLVRRFAEIERFSHVIHLVSAVEGKLRAGCDSFDALASCFPAGTVTGAPKVRAMEIIDALEPARRGPYAGAVFYRGFDGALDSAIAIRIVYFSGGRAHVQAGAGIVADSDPAREFRETEEKARAALSALERAEGIA